MDKRIQKRHKRQVARAKEQGKTQEPDLRTSEPSVNTQNRPMVNS